MTTVHSEVRTGEPLALDAVAVEKSNGETWVYYVLPSVDPADKVRLKARSKAFRRLRRDQRRGLDAEHPGFRNITREFIEFTDDRGWRPCPRRL